MNKLSLDALARELRTKVDAGDRKVASSTVFGGHEKTLRQTLIVMGAGGELGEHESPGDATVHVLHGRVSLDAGSESWEGRTGDLLIIPEFRHGIRAREDAVFLLTVAKS
ncbi:MAG: cupin domain-containing protein [Tomitella sp.]|nr:cupin domain-containing protein [Tomitella sp.]